MATLAEQLTSVQDAIEAILSGGQSITKGDRTLTRANLKDLRDQERSLRERISTEAGVRRTVAEF